MTRFDSIVDFISIRGCAFDSIEAIFLSARVHFILFQASVGFRIIISWCDFQSFLANPLQQKKKNHKNRLMDPRLNERKKRLLQDLSCILQELEEISAAQEMEGEPVDSVVLCEHLCQPAENSEQLEILAEKEHGMHNHIDHWFQSVL